MNKWEKEGCINTCLHEGKEVVYIGTKTVLTLVCVFDTPMLSITSLLSKETKEKQAGMNVFKKWYKQSCRVYTSVTPRLRGKKLRLQIKEYIKANVSQI